jgi:hypothetical protein
MKKNSVLIAVLLSLLLTVGIATAQTVVINEAYSRGVAGDLDWIEVYNTSSSPVDISGYKIYDNGGQSGSKPKKLFPASTILPAKGFAAIIVDTASFGGDLSGFGIGSGGETVWLENADGTLIDSSVIPALGTDTSFARIPDGSKAWRKTTPRTKGKTNVFIKMNEIYSRGAAGNLDWVEIHNSSTASIDISGFKIYDNGGQAGTKSKKLFPAGTIVAANGFAVIIVDTATFVGDTSGFGIGSGGETLWLENAAGLLIDTVAVPALGIDTSYARVPDGSNIMVKKTPLTKGVSNGTGTSVRSDRMTVNGYELLQNYPNPFNPSTTIRFRLAASGTVKVVVFDLLGKEIATLVDGQRSAGEHTVQFNAAQHASGLYFYLLQSGSYSEMKKMILIK